MTQAVILAGGLGTRLRPITETIPKPMVEVNSQPFLYWQLLELKKQNFKKVLLLTGYRGEQIEAHFKDGESMGLELSYSCEPEPMGTGGALLWAEKKLESQFLLLNGDSFLRAPFQKMIDDMSGRSLDVLISCYDDLTNVPVPANIKASKNLVIAYEKGAGTQKGFDLVDSGVYVVSKNILNQLSNPSQLESLWPDLILKQKLGVFLVQERFYDIGTPERLKLFEEKLGDYF